MNLPLPSWLRQRKRADAASDAAAPSRPLSQRALAASADEHSKFEDREVALSGSAS
jgi:hypothetical protein